MTGFSVPFLDVPFPDDVDGLPELAGPDGRAADVLARARDAGVARQLVPAVDRASWDAIRTLCAAEPGLRRACEGGRYGEHERCREGAEFGMTVDAHV